MKKLIKLTGLLGLFAIMFYACDKDEDLPYYGNSSDVTITASTSDVALEAKDSLSVGLSITFSDPSHATDLENYKVVVEIDTAGNEFSDAVQHTVIGEKSKVDFLGKDINKWLLDNFGYKIGEKVSMEVRAFSSFANNNQLKVSNVLAISMTAYLVPPKVEIPASGELFIVGDATMGGWDNPVPENQKFTKISDTFYEGVFYLNSGKEYLLLPVNGSWDIKYSVADKTLEGLGNGGVFGKGLSDNIPAPAASGYYKITVDFQYGEFNVAAETPVIMLPANGELYILGSAVGSWENPVEDAVRQKLKKVSDTQYEITINLVGGEEFLLVPENGSWDNKYSVEDKSIADLWKGGAFGFNLGDNFPGPPTDGIYKIQFDFQFGKFTVTEVQYTVVPPATNQLFIVGDATAGGWTNPVPVPSQEFAKLDDTTWGGIFTLVGGKEYLILPENGNWDNKYSVADKTIENMWSGSSFGFNLSDNFPSPPTDGLYKIIVDFKLGTFSVTEFTDFFPTSLHIVGSATPGDWGNDVNSPLPDQVFVKVNSVEWSLTLTLTGGQEFLLLPEFGSWDSKYAVEDNTIPDLWKGGTLVYLLSGGNNIPGPPSDGSYKITFNALNKKFKVE